MHRRLLTTTIVAATAAVLVAGCGASSSGGATGTNESSAPPKTELVDAVRALGSGSALTTTLGLDTTAANLRHLSSEGGSTPLTPQQAAALASARLTVAERAPSGKTLAQAASSGAGSHIAAEVTGTASGTTYLDLVETGTTVYLRLDLKDLLGLAGDSSQYQTLVVRARTLPAFVRDFVAGRFISLPNSTLTTLESLAKAGAGANGAQVPSSAQLRQLGDRLEAAVLADLSVARTRTGTTDQLTATGNARTLSGDVLSTIKSGIPALASQLGSSSTAQVPDQQLRATASVTGGALSRLEFDVGQFSPHHTDTLPVAMTFIRSAPSISAPSAATPVDLQSLIGFLSAFAGSSTSVGAGSTPSQPAQ